MIDSKNFENKSLLNQDYEENYKSTVILFDYNSYELNKQAINILNTIKTKLTDKSEIEIIGFTDETGDSKYNKLLSEKRAYEVANYIQATNMSIKGAGTSKLSILRNSPESNLYSRSVRIIYNVK